MTANEEVLGIISDSMTHLSVFISSRHACAHMSENSQQ